jgi:hypothetical protein
MSDDLPETRDIVHDTILGGYLTNVPSPPWKPGALGRQLREEEEARNNSSQSGGRPLFDVDQSGLSRSERRSLAVAGLQGLFYLFLTLLVCGGATVLFFWWLTTHCTPNCH